MDTIKIDGNSLKIADVARVARGECEVILSDEARGRMEESRALVERFVDEGRTVYGITTGFGVFSEVLIGREEVLELQRNLILSHCAGVGEPFPVAIARAMMLLRANALAKGFSGIRTVVVERLIEMLNRGVVPVIPSQGSVGASGDLAPLAQLAAALMGEGEVFFEGSRISAREGLRVLGCDAIVYEAKEGIAMINGTQAISAVGALALAKASTLLDVADLAAAMTLDALMGTDAAFDERIHLARPHDGQVLVAKRMRELLAGSGIRESHRDCGKVQDAYSLRCVPQVHGAARDVIGFAAGKLGIEINSATDNPLVFAADGVSFSGGNFHGAPVAVACDVGAISAADLASISERRIERLVNPDLSGLPAFLVRKGGLHSGFMIAQVTAAALVSESKTLAHPASVDSIPTSANKEDHVSMGPTAAWKFARAVDNLEKVLAIEIMCAAQALELRRPLRSSERIEKAIELIRTRVDHWEGDRFLQPDLEAMVEMMEELGAIAGEA